ncbi:MAG: hypothetical protein F2520_12045 [Actinobacteria bacterium]|nr:hypothetical protein [Actinomycetota bacterium]MTA78981.1 hypothetical protein [Actinomycetota bacterium]
MSGSAAVTITDNPSPVEAATPDAVKPDVATLDVATPDVDTPATADGSPTVFVLTAFTTVPPSTFVRSQF